MIIRISSSIFMISNYIIIKRKASCNIMNIIIIISIDMLMYTRIILDSYQHYQYYTMFSIIIRQKASLGQNVLSMSTTRSAACALNT